MHNLDEEQSYGHINKEKDVAGTHSVLLEIKGNGLNGLSLLFYRCGLKRTLALHLNMYKR